MTTTRPVDDVSDWELPTDHVMPRDLEEARDAVLLGAGERTALQFFGAGTKLAWGGPLGPVGRRIDTKCMDQLLEHDAGDLTATVQAGLPVARLQEALAEQGQWFAVDPPLAHAPGETRRATVGGVFAAGDGGPRRLRYGGIRDLVTGVTVVLADGTVARSGGKVIKNVAGYDLVKLFCGSLGTLGLVAELHLRLHPLPEISLTLRTECDAAVASAMARDIQRSTVVASAIDWTSGTLLVRLEGRAEGVDEQRDEVVGLARVHGLRPEQVDGAVESALWDEAVEELAGRPGETVLRAGTLPARLPEVAASLQDVAGRHDVQHSLASHCGLGLHTARLWDADAPTHAAVLEEWRGRIAALGGHVTLRQRLLGMDELVDAFGPPPSSFGLMRAVKEQLDPDGRCAPGRFVGGL